MHTARDAELVEALRSYEGTPREILENEELLTLLMPMIRADFEVLETYSPRRGACTDVPTTVLGGSADSLVAPAELLRWGARAPVVAVRTFRGGHFYLAEQERTLIASVTGDLLADLRPGVALTADAAPSRQDRSTR